MSRHAALEAPFADKIYTFRLGLDEIEELERRRDLGIFRIAERLAPDRREATLGEILDVIRLGLMGGGLAPVDALALTRAYVDRRPLDENRDLAYTVALAALMRLHGSELEAPPGDPLAGEQIAAKTSPEGSISPPSGETPS